MVGARGGMQVLVALVCGGVFAGGLALSGMTLPKKVQGFLDVTGAWDPTLAFVMGGAVVVYAALYFGVVRRRQAPVFAPAFKVPTGTRIDGRLLLGSACFGVGWGLSGLCPGPALVSVGTGMGGLGVFLLAMVAGMGVFRAMEGRRGGADDL